MNDKTGLALLTAIVFLLIGILILWYLGSFTVFLVLEWLAFALIAAGIIEFLHLIIGNGYTRHRNR
jgi:hypothetical protein